MMPFTRINDATFADLKVIATWLGTGTPSETIDALVREKMDALDLERDFDDAVTPSLDADGDLVFETTPGLTFTRVLSARVNNAKAEKMNWASLLVSVIAAVKAKGLAEQELVPELQVPAKAVSSDEEGYKFYAALGISVQGQSAQDAWKEVRRLADKFAIPVEVRFQWRENPKAQHPGRIGVVRAGQQDPSASVSAL